MYEKRLRSPSHFGIFSNRPIQAGTVLFTHDDWIEDEAHGWDTLRVEDVEGLAPRERELYLRYAYDTAFGSMVGTFDWTRARHISNFMNHSCAPNMIYGHDDDIIAAHDIAPGEELTIDYGNFIVNVDQDFTCRCQDASCRHHIHHDDWLELVPRLGFHFPKFMHDAIASRLAPRRATGRRG
jgi:hypothetical protein